MVFSRHLFARSKIYIYAKTRPKIYYHYSPKRLYFKPTTTNHIMKKAIPLIFFLILLIACVEKAGESTQPEMKPGNSLKDIILQTADNWNIYANFTKSSDDCVLLVHMLGSDSTSWSVLADDLNKNRFSTLAIDLRGHGKSTGNVLLNDFTEEDFHNMILDVAAGVDYLKSENCKKINIIGASIGSNLALMRADNDINTVVLLSPGMDYHGVSIRQSMTLYANPVMIFASRMDSYSYQSSMMINQAFRSYHEFIPLEGSAHGTDMLPNPAVRNKIVEWVKKY